MAKRFSRKDLKHDEIAEAAFDFGHWIEENWRAVATGVGAVAVIVIAVLAWYWMANAKQHAADDALAAAFRAYDKAEVGNFTDDNDLSAALSAAEGVVDKYPGTRVARVALYYRAAVLEHLDRLDEAVESLEQSLADETSPSTQRGVAELLLVNLYAEQGRTDDAMSKLEGLIDGPATGLPKEVALLRLGELRKSQGDLEGARKAWQRVIDEYPDSSATGEARRYLGPQA